MALIAQWRERADAFSVGHELALGRVRSSQLRACADELESALSREDRGETREAALLAALGAARDALAAFGKQAGWLPQQQGYSATMTGAELNLAEAVSSIDHILAAEASSRPAPQVDDFFSGQRHMQSRIADVLRGEHPNLAALVEKLPCHGPQTDEDRITVALAEAVRVTKPMRDRALEAEHVTADILHMRLDAARPAPQGWQPHVAEAVEAIHAAVRGDEKSECWTIRRFLDERDVFNDDIQGVERLIEEVCKFLIKPDPSSVASVTTGAQDDNG